MTTAPELAGNEMDRRRVDAQPAQSTVRRLNLNLPERTFLELKRLATQTGRSLTEMIRIGIALAQVAIDEEVHGRKLAVIDQEGNIVKEIIPLR